MKFTSAKELAERSKQSWGAGYEGAKREFDAAVAKKVEECSGPEVLVPRVHFTSTSVDFEIDTTGQLYK